jgi:hypothetical protein
MDIAACCARADASARFITLLAELDLSFSRLSGPVPDWLPSMGSHLMQFKAQQNQLSGTVPSGLGSMPKLKVLWLHHNPGLSGALPADLALAVAEAALFVKALEEHLATRVLAPAAATLDAALAAAGDLDGVRAAHAAYLAAVCRGTLVAPDALWTLLAPRVRRLLALAPRLAAAARSGAPAPSAAADAAACRAEVRATLRTLAQKLRAGGPAQQMADCEGLLARLDFNNWFTATADEA